MEADDYSRLFMSKETLPSSIDTRCLDASGARFEGTVSLAAMRRLRELVLTPEGTVRASIEVRSDEALYVDGVVSARMHLQCQRCLEPKEILLRAPFRLLVVGSATEADMLAGDSDSLIAPGGVIDLLSALEDELLLALPPVAMHESDKACAQQGLRVGTPEAVDAMSHHQSPFAVLAQLKKRGD